MTNKSKRWDFFVTNHSNGMRSWTARFYTVKSDWLPAFFIQGQWEFQSRRSALADARRVMTSLGFKFSLKKERK